MINEKQFKKDPWHPANIKAALELAGFTQRKVADDLHVSGAAVSHVIAGKSVSKRIADFIANTIKVSVDDIWPDRYTNSED